MIGYRLMPEHKLRSRLARNLGICGENLLWYGLFGLFVQVSRMEDL